MGEDRPLTDDLDRRTRVRALIDGARRQAIDTARPRSRPPLRAVSGPDCLPGYELMDEIHRGGQGVVYRARQRATGRIVAIKIMREGPFGGPRDHARFEREVRVLAQLNDPNIVGVLDSGIAEGSAYFVMDYVDGVPLDQYVQEVEKSKSRKVETEARLRLFAKVCDAVHAAHLRGIIHRDLKPNNVLVDAAGEPHILDFGLAKLDATDGEAGEAATVTTAGHFVGSLPWASPEQAAGASEHIDLRTDVYSLGVMLYQTLTGRFPYSVAGNMRDVLDRIMTAEPAPLRQRAAGFRLPPWAPSLPALMGGRGASRGTTSAGVNPAARLIDDELETIVLKCLSKERERRYQSAGDLARDIQHYLADEPIEAKRDSGWYMLKKSLHRHRLPVGAAVGFVLMLAVFGLAMASARTRAEREADKSRQVLAFLQNMLAGVDPEDIGPGALTVREVLDHAAVRLERELVDQPQVAASVHQTLGNHYSTLGLYFDADRHLRKAVELRRTFNAGDDPELAEALTDLAANLQDKRDIADAEAPTREALDMRRRLFGQDSLEVGESLHDLASVLIETGRPREAEPLVRESLDTRRRLLGAEHAEVATSTGMLGWCLMALGRLDEAETALRDAVEMVRRLSGDNERALAARLTFLSDVLRARGHYVEEETVVREAIDIRRNRLAQDHPALAWNLFCLAQIRRRLGDLDEAETACRKALDIYTKKRAPPHEDIADCQQVLAQIYDARGRFIEAEPWWSACLEMRRKLLSPEDPDIAFAESALAQNRVAQSGVFRTPDEAAGP